MYRTSWYVLICPCLESETYLICAFKHVFKKIPNDIEGSTNFDIDMSTISGAKETTLGYDPLVYDLYGNLMFLTIYV